MEINLKDFTKEELIKSICNFLLSEDILGEPWELWEIEAMIRSGYWLKTLNKNYKWCKDEL